MLYIFRHKPRSCSSYFSSVSLSFKGCWTRCLGWGVGTCSPHLLHSTPVLHILITKKKENKYSIIYLFIFNARIENGIITRAQTTSFHVEGRDVWHATELPRLKYLDFEKMAVEIPAPHPPQINHLFIS